MTGRGIVLTLLAIALLFGAALVYMQFYAFYEETEADSVEIAGARYPVTGWQGIDASSSPLKLRACFRFAGDPAEVTGPAPEDPTPLVPPPWFDCFDAEAIAKALAAGEARAILAATGEAQGVERVVAVFPDGRGYMWRQLTPEFANQ